MRLGLWNHCAAQRLEIPFKVTWYESLSVLTYLGNDLSRCLYVGGTYEPNEFMFLKEVLRPGMTFIDVGANDGLYTLFASKCVTPGGKVLALEPSSREFRRLKENLRINRLWNVIPLQMAASDHQGYGTLKLAEFGHEGQNTLGEFAYDIQQKGTERVPLRKLDDLVQEHACERIDVLKIDAEGSELAVLRGARNVLTIYRTIVQFELLTKALRLQGATEEEILHLLSEVGYSCWLYGPKGFPEPLPKGDKRDLDGANLIAVPVEKRSLMNRYKTTSNVSP